MADTFAIFSGLYDLENDTPVTDSGINYFCTYNASSGEYFTTTGQHLTINIPSITSYTANGGLITIDVNGEPCGNVWEQLVAQGNNLNSRQNGPAKEIGDGGTFPLGGSGFQLGVLNEDQYSSATQRIMSYAVANYPPASPTILPSTFTSSLGGGGVQWDTTNSSLQPGHCATKELYSVVVPSTGQQPTTGKQGRRIHFQCNTNTGVLADLLRRLQSTGQYGFTPTVAGGTISLSATNEEAAAKWLVHGYGIMNGTNLAFTTYEGP
tara:strand:- start:40 stop:837 length:798 start_codon:yes stop_codon:yes gene_type:complete